MSCTDETREKMSKSARKRGYLGSFDYDHSGVNNPMHGKTHTEKSMKSMIELKRALASVYDVYGLKGRFWYYNPDTDECSYFSPDEVPEGWIKGRKYSRTKTNWECKTRRVRIRCIDTEEVYERSSDCARANRFSPSKLAHMRKGQVRMIKGLCYQRLN